MILIISDSIPTKSFQRSGIFGYDDFKFFASLGYDVKMVILQRITYERRHLFNLKKQTRVISKQIEEIRSTIIDNQNIEFIPYFSLIKPFVFKEDLFLFRKSKFHKQKFDYVIVHNMLHTGLNIDWIRKQFPGSKIILKEHDNWLLYPKMVRHFAKKRITKYDKILANSESTKQSFQEIFLEDDDLKQLAPDIEIDYPKFNVNVTKIIKPKSSVLQILTVANLLQAKGFEESFSLLKILEESRIEWFWTIIGKGPFYDKIIQLANELRMLDKISILPEVQKPGLYNYMKNSNVYLQLSYKETFGIAPLEAFSYYNRMIISDHITSIHELGLSNNKNILIIKDIHDISAQKEQVVDFVLQGVAENDFDEVLIRLNKTINSF